MTIIPFRPILGNIDPNSFEKQPDGDFNTGFRFNGKDIFKKTVDIQELSIWLPEEHAEYFVKAEGMYYDGTNWHPLKISSIGPAGIALDGQTIEAGYTGYCDLFYTETEPNKNRMAKFVVAGIVLAIGTIVGIMSYSPEVMQVVFNLP